MCSQRMPIGSLDINPGYKKSAISAKTDQNPDFKQNRMFFFVLSALNHCKRSQRGLRFVWDVLRPF